MQIAVRWLLVVGLLGVTSEISLSADELVLWFPSEWAESQRATAITQALSQEAGMTIRPRIAPDYPTIFAAFQAGTPCLVYVGSFAQALIRARDLGIPLLQAITGKEMYAGVMLYPKGKDPQAILKSSPMAIAFAVGASSGESSAKAATAGRASIALQNHRAVAGAVKAGKADAGFVKNWWWEDNKDKFPELAMYRVPEISMPANPDSILTASKAVPADVREKITRAAMARPDVFGVSQLVPLNGSALDFSLALMKKGGIDPLTYQWK
jgi:ABC-type phosphate/phosphonate transport system substrate-binding protein